MSVARPITRNGRSVSLEAAPGQTLFALPGVHVWDAADLAVYLRPHGVARWTRSTTGWTPAVVAGAGSVTFADPPRAIGSAIRMFVRVESRRVDERIDDVTRSGRVRSEPIEATFDRKATIDQELRRDIDRLEAVAVVVGDGQTPLGIDADALRGQAVGVDASGNFTAVATIADTASAATRAVRVLPGQTPPPLDLAAMNGAALGVRSGAFEAVASTDRIRADLAMIEDIGPRAIRVPPGQAGATLDVIANRNKYVYVDGAGQLDGIDPAATPTLNLINLWNPIDFAGVDQVAQFEAAQAAAADGDVLEITHAWSFTRAFTLTKRLRVVWRGGRIDRGGAAFDLFTVAPGAQGASLHHVHIDGRADVYPAGLASLVIRTEKVRVHEPRIRNSPGHSILIDGSTSLTLTGDGATTSYAHPLGIAGPWQVEVWNGATGLVHGVDYTVSGANIVFAAPIPAGQTRRVLHMSFRAQSVTIVAPDIAAGNGVGIAQFNTYETLILHGRIDDVGLEAVTIDVNSHHSRIVGTHCRGACRIGGVGGIGVDLAQYFLIEGVTVEATESGLPGIGVQSQAGDSIGGRIVDCQLRDNEGAGVHLKTRPIVHPAATGGSGTSESVLIDTCIFYGSSAAGSVLIDAGTRRPVLGANNRFDVAPTDNSGAMKRLDRHRRTAEIEWIAHRGSPFETEENTLLGYTHAERRGRFTWETDIQATADGNFVLFHDTDIAAHTTGTGEVPTKTVAELQALRYDSLAGTDHKEAYIPTLDEFLDLAAELRPRRINMEYKRLADVRAARDAQIGQIIAKMQARGLSACSTIYSADINDLVQTRWRDSEIEVMYFKPDPAGWTQSDFDILANLGGAAALVSWSALGAQLPFIAQCRRRDIRVAFYTVNHAAVHVPLIMAGADAAMFDRLSTWGP